jgi:hypothetical protein
MRFDFSRALPVGQNPVESQRTALLCSAVAHSCGRTVCVDTFSALRCAALRCEIRWLRSGYWFRR